MPRVYIYYKQTAKREIIAESMACVVGEESRRFMALIWVQIGQRAFQRQSHWFPRITKVPLVYSNQSLFERLMN